MSGYYNNDIDKFMTDWKDRFSYYKKLTSYNTHSKMIVHVDKSHRIQYKDTNLIIDSIKNLIDL